MGNKKKIEKGLGEGENLRDVQEQEGLSLTLKRIFCWRGLDNRS